MTDIPIDPQLLASADPKSVPLQTPVPLPKQPKLTTVAKDPQGQSTNSRTDPAPNPSTPKKKVGSSRDANTPASSSERSTPAKPAKPDPPTDDSESDSAYDKVNKIRYPSPPGPGDSPYLYPAWAMAKPAATKASKAEPTAPKAKPSITTPSSSKTRKTSSTTTTPSVPSPSPLPTPHPVDALPGPPWRCHVRGCTQDFPSLRQREIHEKDFHQYRHRFICGTCGKSSFDHGYLVMHELTHTYPEKCPVSGCGKCLSSKYTLKRHIKEQHPGEKYDVPDSRRQSRASEAN